jgi:hypothetical protein
MNTSMKDEFIKELDLFEKANEWQYMTTGHFGYYMYNSFIKRFNVDLSETTSVAKTIYTPESFCITSNLCMVCFPVEGILIILSVADAMDLSGINLFLKHDNTSTYKQYELIDTQLNYKVKSPKIIVTDLDMSSIIIVKNNHLKDKTLLELISR